MLIAAVNEIRQALYWGCGCSQPEEYMGDLMYTLNILTRRKGRIFKDKSFVRPFCAIFQRWKVCMGDLKSDGCLFCALYVPRARQISLRGCKKNVLVLTKTEGIC